MVSTTLDLEKDSFLRYYEHIQAELKLLKCPCGTFLLRFSDRELGGISIAWVENGRVVMLQPFCSKDFGIRSLEDRINDVRQCMTLYPDVPKCKAFGNQHSPNVRVKTAKGYVKHTLRLSLPEEFSRILSNLDTPRHDSGQSSDQTVTSTMQRYCENSVIFYRQR